MKNVPAGLYLFLLFVIFCLFNAFPITYIKCDKIKDICICKQFIRNTVTPYKLFYSEPVSNIREIISFGNDGDAEGGYIGVKLKDSKKKSSIGPLVDCRFPYDLFSMKQTEKFAENFNNYLNNNITTYSHIHINIWGVIIISLLLLSFLFLKSKDK